MMARPFGVAGFGALEARLLRGMVGPMANDALPGHILNVSATMVGVCVTVVSLVKLLEVQRHQPTHLDELVAVDAVMFMVSALLSYLSLRGHKRAKERLERLADRVFVLALLGLTVCSLLFAFEMV